MGVCSVDVCWFCTWANSEPLSGPALTNRCMNNAGKQAELATYLYLRAGSTVCRESVRVRQGPTAGGCYRGLPVGFLAATLGRNGCYWLRVMSPFQTTTTKRMNLSEATEILSIYGLALISKIFKLCVVSDSLLSCFSQSTNVCMTRLRQNHSTHGCYSTPP